MINLRFYDIAKLMFTKLNRWLKKYFIPAEHNDYKPHILRREATFLILGVIFLVEVLFLVQVFVLFPKIKFFAQILENVLIEETNSNRLADNLLTLKINPLLTEAAQEKAQDMAQKGYFNHISPEGITPWYWIQKVGYQYSYAGENLAINFSDSKDIVDAWMNSSSHRSNILNGHFTEIGIGIAKGIYQNRETVFIVQMFGRPAQEAAVPTPKSVALNPAPTSAINSPSQEQMFIAVKNTGESEVLPMEISVAKAEAEQNLSISSLIGKLVASPRMRTEYLYLIILAVISLALILNILIKAKIQHPHIIINGIVLILIINTALIINYYLIVANSKIF